MAKKHDPTKQYFEKLAESQPVLPVISDQPLKTITAHMDRFDLCYRLGPVFDILRHKDTQTPTTIAIYGDWGTGKTSAMCWLEGLIKEWDKHVQTPHKKLHTVWFYPWKYHEKEDVWRGLIAEVIKASIDVKGVTVERVKKAVKQFGLFLGKGFVHVMSSATLKAGPAGIGQAEIDLSSVKDILEEYHRTAHPEKAFLNDFEKSLEEWIRDTISEDERIVIFIDDLDRCMPEVALQVLEALKLYLNIERLIFVVGVDKDVINPLVKQHYSGLGLDGYKSENYLAKMFQTEVSVGPSEKQVSEYLLGHIDSLEYFGAKYLEPDEKELFTGLVSKLADRNPREVKRLINSAVMAGAGVEMMKKAEMEGVQLSFKQGLQVFFIRRILEQRKYEGKFSRLVGSKDGDAFFEAWSEIVREYAGTPDFPLSFQVPADYYEQYIKSKDIQEGSLKEASEQMKRRDRYEMPEDFHAAYYTLIQNRRFEKLCLLLADTDLGSLMRIEYSTKIAGITQKVEEPQAKGVDNEAIVEAIIRKKVNQEKGALSQELLDTITVLHLSQEGLTKVPEIVFKLANLQKLWLYDNQLTSMPKELVKLASLQTLILSFNQLTSVPAELVQLANLEGLSLDSNQLMSVPAELGKLARLWRLSLDGNQLTSVPPELGQLPNLLELNLSNNQLASLPSELGQLTKLNVLELSDNQLTSIPAELGQLANLQVLDLSDNQLTSIPAELGQLVNLQGLSVSGNQLTSVPPEIGQLANLQEIYFSDNQLTSVPPELGHLKKLEALFIIEGNKIPDEQIKQLKSDLPDCKIT